MNNNTTESPRRTMRLEARVTKEEYEIVARRANECGLSMSKYIREVALGHHPRKRLTEREVEALCCLADARGDLIRISAAVRDIQADNRAFYFGNPKFVEQWMLAAVSLIERWKQIQDYLTK